VIKQMIKHSALLGLLCMAGAAMAQVLPQGFYPPFGAGTAPVPTENGSLPPAAISAVIPQAQSPAPLIPPTVDSAATNSVRDQLVVVNPAPRGRMFGSQLFGGTFRGTLNPGFNPEYVLAVGDRLIVRLWGGVNFEGGLTIDPQGNIFIPSVGPIPVAGVRSGDLNKVVEQGVRKVYKGSTGVYAALDASQPVKVFVTGFVRQPGLYGGVSSDSPISYLDKAGGVDAERGSYVDVVVKRGDKIRKRINLYDFLLNGRLDLVQLQDGDVIVVAARKHTFSVNGEAYNPYDFEFFDAAIPLKKALGVAQVKPGATHVSVVRRQGSERRTEYYPLTSIDNVTLNDGDVVTITADRYPGTIQVRIEGAHSGEHALVLPYGASLKDVLAKIKPNQMSRVDAIQIYRRSVADRQKEILAVALQKLEQAVLSARSATNEEASLRVKEADLVLRFIERAKNIQPKGQVILAAAQRDQTLLEDGDVVVIPERTSVVIVHGEVLFPNALSWEKGVSAETYIEQAGGFAQAANTSKVVLIHQNGSTVLAKGDEELAAGDEIMVLPKIETKSIEVTRSLTQILYQIAFTAKVAFGL